MTKTAQAVLALATLAVALLLTASAAQAAAPANDAFAAAAAPPDDWVAVSNVEATKEPGEPDHAGDPGGHSVWFSWTPTQDERVEIAACPQGGFDPVLAVYTGTAVDDLTLVAENDDWIWPREELLCSKAGGEVVVDALGGTTYRIAVDGAAGTTGGFRLTMNGAPTHDKLAKARKVGGSYVGQIDHSNWLATREPEEPQHAGLPSVGSVWYSWTPTESGPMAMVACAAGTLDLVLAVYTGATHDQLTPVAANDDQPSGWCGGTNSEAQFNAIAGTTYKVAVASKNRIRESFNLYFIPAPSNDAFASATVLEPPLPISTGGRTTLASKELNEPDHGGDPGGHSVWYSWEPAVSGAVEIEVCSQRFDPRIAVYEGGTLAGLTPVQAGFAGRGECAAGRSIRLNVFDDRTYRIAVDGFAGGFGPFDIRLRPVVPEPRTLTANLLGDGEGVVRSSPAGIDCGSICEHEFEDAETVTLSATPAPGSTFAGWSGEACAGTGPCEVTMYSDFEVVATFEAIPAEPGPDPGEGDPDPGEGDPDPGEGDPDAGEGGDKGSGDPGEEGEGDGHKGGGDAGRAGGESAAGGNASPSTDGPPAGDSATAPKRKPRSSKPPRCRKASYKKLRLKGKPRCVKKANRRIGKK